MKYDVFISYRRDGGSHAALTLYNSLTRLGYRVFYDVRSLRSGEFDTALFHVIEQCKDFLLVLSPGALDRCTSEDDWVRQEIEYAMHLGKNIIPVTTQSSFSFPDQLPESFAKLPLHNRLDASTAFYDAFILKLQTFMKARPSSLYLLLHPTKNRAMVIALALLIVCLGFGGYRLYDHLSAFPHNAKQRSLVSETIAYLMLNNTHANNALSAYNQALSDCKTYLSSTGTLTRESLQLSLDHAISQTIAADTMLLPLDSGLSDKLDGTPIDKGDASMQKEALHAIFSTMFDVLTYLSNGLIDDSMLLPATKLSWVETAQRISALDADALFYMLNDLLLPVDSKALFELKTKMLPALTAIHNTSQTWQSDPIELSGKLETISNTETDLVMRLYSAIGDEQRRTDAMHIRNSELQSLTELYREIYERYRPLETDTADALWIKGTKFMTFGFGTAAADCFARFAQKSDAQNAEIYGRAAEELAMRSQEIGVLGGSIVCLHEDGKPCQPFEIGDVIYAVNGTPVYTDEEYFAIVDPILASDAITPPVFSVLRFANGMYSLLEIPYDLSAGRIAVLTLCFANPGV